MGRRQSRTAADQNMDDAQQSNEKSFHSNDEDHHMAPPSPAETDDSFEDSFHTAEEDSDVGKEYSDPPLLPLELLRASEVKIDQMTRDSSSEAPLDISSNPARPSHVKPQRRASADPASNVPSKSSLRKERVRLKSKAVLTGRVRKFPRPEPSSGSDSTSGRDAILHRRLLAASHTNPDIRPPTQRRPRSRR